MGDDTKTALVRASNVSLRNVRRIVGASAARKQADQKQHVTALEVSQACERLHPLPAAWLRFLWCTGARCSEALGVRWIDVDFPRHAIYIETLKRKAHTMRSVPMSNALAGELVSLARAADREPADRVFPWSRSRSFEIVRDALLAAGVDRPRCHPHSLRHGHAIHAMSNGVPLPVIQQQLGHSSLSTTGMYTVVSFEERRDFYERVIW